MRNSFEIFSCTECVTTPMAREIDTLLKVVLAEIDPQYLKVFFEKHRNDTNLLGVDIWDDDMVKSIGMELVFFIKNREHFFNESS